MCQFTPRLGDHHPADGGYPFPRSRQGGYPLPRSSRGGGRYPPVQDRSQEGMAGGYPPPSRSDRRMGGGQVPPCPGQIPGGEWQGGYPPPPSRSDRRMEGGQVSPIQVRSQNGGGGAAWAGWGRYPPVQVRSQGTPLPGQIPGRGQEQGMYHPPTPPSRSDPRMGGYPLLEQHSVYLLRGGRYASYVHAGGLSCSTMPPAPPQFHPPLPCPPR